MNYKVQPLLLISLKCKAQNLLCNYSILILKGNCTHGLINIMKIQENINHQAATGRQENDNLVTWC